MQLQSQAKDGTDRTSPGTQEKVASVNADCAAEDDVDEVKTLTAEEARAWRQRQPAWSVWTVLRWQVLLTVLVTVLAYGMAREASVAWSAFYGGLSILLPSAVMAWGLTSSALARLFARDASASLAGLFAWEGIKVLLCVAMLWFAPQAVNGLNWLALVAGLVVVLKAYGLGLWLRPGAKK